jgi:hypothetical protein
MLIGVAYKIWYRPHKIRIRPDLDPQHCCSAHPQKSFLLFYLSFFFSQIRPFSPMFNHSLFSNKQYSIRYCTYYLFFLVVGFIISALFTLTFVHLKIRHCHWGKPIKDPDICTIIWHTDCISNDHTSKRPYLEATLPRITIQCISVHNFADFS